LAGAPRCSAAAIGQRVSVHPRRRERHAEAREVENDYANDQSPSNLGAEAFLRPRAAAYKACFEHMPVAPTMLPSGQPWRPQPLADRMRQPEGPGAQHARQSQERWLVDRSRPTRHAVTSLAPLRRWRPMRGFVRKGAS
jgi:hypothetical protein